MHRLASAAEPLSDELIRKHRAVTVADSVQLGTGISIGLLAGQDVFTVAGMPAKLDAQIRGLGVGFLPTCLAQPYIDTGRLVVKRVERARIPGTGQLCLAQGQPGCARAGAAVVARTVAKAGNAPGPAWRGRAQVDQISAHDRGRRCPPIARYAPQASLLWKARNS